MAAYGQYRNMIKTGVQPPTKRQNMKKYFESKLIADSVRDVSENDRRVKVAISKMGNRDLDNDVIEHGAYTKTLAERGPKGANMIWHLTDHNPSLKSAVGKFSDIYVDGDYLVGITTIPNTTWGNDVLEFYKTGHINQHSIGFRTIKAETQKSSEGDYNLIKEVLLFEGSAVLWGANPLTPTLSAGKSLTKEDIAVEHEKLSRELSLLVKSLKDGRFTDDAFEFMDIRLAQINEALKTLLTVEPETTAPVVETVQPEVDLTELGSEINNFIKSIKK